MIVYREQIQTGMFFGQCAFRKGDLQYIGMDHLIDTELLAVKNLRLLTQKPVQRRVRMNGYDIFYQRHGCKNRGIMW